MIEATKQFYADVKMPLPESGLPDLVFRIKKENNLVRVVIQTRNPLSAELASIVRLCEHELNYLFHKSLKERLNDKNSPM